MRAIYTHVHHRLRVTGRPRCTCQHISFHIANILHGRPRFMQIRCAHLIPTFMRSVYLFASVLRYARRIALQNWLGCCIPPTVQRQGLLPISQWASWATWRLQSDQIIGPARHALSDDVRKKKKTGRKVGGWAVWRADSQSGQMGAFDIRRSRFIHSSEYSVTARLSRGSWFKEGGRVLWTLPCMLEWVLKDTSVCRGQWKN